jgi:hypothetical protein
VQIAAYVVRFALPASSQENPFAKCEETVVRYMGYRADQMGIDIADGTRVVLLQSTRMRTPAR